jgi:multimeric flavodoxin WrbA
MSKERPRVLGLSASLRNARFGAGSEALVEHLMAIQEREELDQYLRDQAQIRLDDFVAAGRDRGLGFDHIYRNLQKQKTDQGLSNSEVVLAAALWGALQKGCDIEHIGLSRHFPAHQPDGQYLDELKERLMAADAILLSTPVYFGDRSSVAHDLIEMIRTDQELREAVQGKVFAGVSVGAKRNGGQETTLIYMLLDMTGLGMLGVGNDSETTSQYGGTALGGDVGTVGTDQYGLDTSVGAGRRIGQVAVLLKEAESVRLEAPLRIHIWVVQNTGKEALAQIEHIAEDLRGMPEPGVNVKIMNVAGADIYRCIACDICPVHVASDENYRCIINRNGDFLKEEHMSFLEPDVILVAAHSPSVRDKIASNYQRFMERTRYLRRGDYILSDVVVAPLILQEFGAKENLHLRILTSMLRHHTVMTHPIIGYMHDGEVVNGDDVRADLKHLVEQAARVTAGRCLMAKENAPNNHYQPLGYVLSTIKDKELETVNRRECAMVERNARKLEDALARIDVTDITK